MLGSLYNSDILALSAALKNTRLETPSASARKVAKLCGSWVEIDVIMDGGVVADYALRVQACALGQVKEGGDAPEGRFEKLALLKGVASYPARHGSTLLAFDAAVEAVTQVMGES